MQEAFSGSGNSAWKFWVVRLQLNAEVGVGIWDVSYRKCVIALRSTYVAIMSSSIRLEVCVFLIVYSVGL